MCSFCGVAVCEPHARQFGLISSCDMCELHLCVDCTGERDLEGPTTTCMGRESFGGMPCRKRACRKHVMACVLLAPKIADEPPTKFQCLDWRAPIAPRATRHSRRPGTSFLERPWAAGAAQCQLCARLREEMGAAPQEPVAEARRRSPWWPSATRQRSRWPRWSRRCPRRWRTRSGGRSAPLSSSTQRRARLALVWHV